LLGKSTVKPLYLRRKCFVGGAAVQWLRDGAKMINTAADRNFGSKRTRQWRRLFCPALTGLGAHIGTNMREAQFWVLQEERQTHISTCDPRGLLIKYDLAKSMEADFGEKERIKSRWEQP
jgi:glycerol kinase